MITRWARVARGTMAAGIAIFVSALFHVAAGGDAPGLLAVVLSLAFCVPVCIVLCGKRLSLWRQVVSVGLSQFVFHALFSLAPSGTHFAAVGGAANIHAAHIHSGSQLVAMGGGASSHLAMMPDNAWMWAGHASAALVTIVALRYGETAFWGLFSTAAIRIVDVSEGAALVPVSTDAPVCRTVDARPAGPRELLVTIGRMRHRGPPAVSLARA